MGYLQICHITLYHTELHLINKYADKYNANKDSRKRIEEAYGNYSAREENTHRRRLERHPRGTGQRTLSRKTNSTCTTTGKLNTHTKLYTYGEYFTQTATSPHTAGIRKLLNQHPDWTEYISDNWLHQTHSVHICPWFTDHAGLSLNILPPTKQRQLSGNSETCSSMTNPSLTS
jgi:hypothetical protein